MRRPRFRSAVPSIVCLSTILFALSTVPAGAQGPELYVVSEPANPTANLPFRLVFSGKLLAFSASEAPADRTVTVEGNIVTVTQKGGLVGVPILYPYAASVDVGPLAEGTYQVEFVEVSEGTPPPIQAGSEKSWVVGSVTVRAPFTVDGPEVAYTRNPVEFTVSRVDTCSSLGEIAVDSTPAGDGAGGTVRIPWLVGCPIQAPPPEPRSYDTGPVGPLDAGLWNIDVVDGRGQVYARKRLEVLPDPVFLRDGRFRLDVVWFNNLASEFAFPVSAPTEDSALYAFFVASNWEMMVKVLDGCDINGHYWVFIAANTDQGFDVLVTDTETGTERAYHNPLGTAAPPVTDTSAFPCE